VRYGFTDGRLSEVTSPGGVKTRYGYDGGGRLSTQTPGSATKPSLTTEYGDDGRVVSQTDGKGAQTGRLRSADLVAQPAGAVSNQWDAAGNLLSRNAAGHTESYAWDKVDRLSAAKLDGKTMASYSYDLAHSSVTTRRPSGLVEVRSLDARDREVELRLTQAGTDPTLRRLSWNGVI
jgi:YD repeat-containing protein